jgi:hypothetical protein
MIASSSAEDAVVASIGGTCSGVTQDDHRHEVAGVGDEASGVAEVNRMVVYSQRMPWRTSRYALGVSSRKSAAKNRTPGTVGPGKIGWKDERHRRSGVERGEQIVLAMLAGVGAGAAGRWHRPVSLQPIERPGDLDDGRVEVLAPAQICAEAQGMATCQRLSIDLGRFAGVTLTDA